jgi:hypothetical protein
VYLHQSEASSQPIGKIIDNNGYGTQPPFNSTLEFCQSPSIKSSYIDWVNLQWPPTTNIAVNGSVTVYVRCYEEGVTLNAGADARISLWVGYNSANTNPNTCTSWTKATFNTQYDWPDEYLASIVSTLTAGIYYYASRIQYDGGAYQFGGYNAEGGGYWDGVNHVSGTLTVGKQLATITLSNTMQLYDGTPKHVMAVTNPAGLEVQILYNVSSVLPVDEGSYTVAASINDATYQGSQPGTLSICTVPQDSLI